MSALLSPLPIMQFFTAAGVPLSGGKLYTYAAGTSTAQATYTDSTGNTANTNPVILNSRGEASVWVSLSQYKYVLKDSTDVLIWTVDNISNGGGLTSPVTASRTGAGTDDFVLGNAVYLRNANAANSEARISVGLNASNVLIVGDVNNASISMTSAAALTYATAVGGAYSLNVNNTNGSNATGVSIYYATGVNGTGNFFLTCTDGASVERASIASNGGLRNFSANNINLSDMRTKDVFEDYTPAMLDELEAKFKAIRRGRFKYNDQTHGDWNYGKSAQSVAEQLPELSGVWNETKVVDGVVKPVPKEEQLIGEYHHDLSQIGEALLVRLLDRVAALEAK
jgi:hypothetical protein